MIGARHGVERLKWLMIHRWPAGYRRASKVYQSVFDRRTLAERKRAGLLFGRFVRAGDLCFDVGANHGARCDVFLELGARVVAIEPQAHCQARLQARFGANPRFHLVGAAVGERTGTANLYLGNVDLISTVSTEWMAEAERIPELKGIGWSQQGVRVPMTTLDAVIAQYGVPAFCKIDVEGYEVEALRGLSQALPLLSLEYTQWKLETILHALDRLAELGSYRFNLSELESMELRFADGDWQTDGAVRRLLEAEYRRNQHGYGDIYARLASG